MDPSKIQGKMREQMTREIKARLDSERKWKFISKKDNNDFYSQSFLNKKIAEDAAERKSRDRSDVDQSTTEASANGGESYFVSDKMFDSMNVCRCGRKKEGTHLIKCLQKSIIKYSDGQVSTGSSPVGGDKDELKPNIPRTSNEIFGFFHSKYVNLERSTFYVTPKANLRHKITDQIYESIIIG